MLVLLLQLEVTADKTSSNYILKRSKKASFREAFFFTFFHLFSLFQKGDNFPKFQYILFMIILVYNESSAPLKN